MELDFDPSFGEDNQPRIHQVLDSNLGHVLVFVPIDYYDRPEIALFDTMASYLRENTIEPLRVVAISVTEPVVNGRQALAAEIVVETIFDV